MLTFTIPAPLSCRQFLLPVFLLLCWLCCNYSCSYGLRNESVNDHVSWSAGLFASQFIHADPYLATKQSGRRPAHRSCRERSPPLARVPTRPRCHYRVAPHAAWPGPPSCRCPARLCGHCRRAPEATSNPGDAASSLSASRLAAGLALRLCSSCVCSRNIRRQLFLPHPDLPRSPAGLRAGPGSWRSQLSAPLRPLFSSSPPPPSSEKAQSQSPSCPNFSPRWDHA